MHQKEDTQTKNMNKIKFTVIFAILLCIFSVQIFAEYYGRDIPDSSEIRKSLVERWFTSDLKYLRLEESQVYKTSAGAATVMKIARVSNIANTIDELKERGAWIYAADMSGQPLHSVSFDGAVALVIGSEGFGISRLVMNKCDFLVNIPMSGQINSLNASVAAGIIMYEVVRQRNL